jgi:hypothetical protein
MTKIIYLRKKIPVKNISKRWLSRNNPIKELNKEEIIKYLKNIFADINLDNYKMEMYKNIDQNKICIYYKEKYEKIVYHGGGRYGSTYSINVKKILKIQKLYHMRDLKEYIKEICYSDYIYNKYKLSPKIYKKINIYEVYDNNNKKYVCCTYLMDKVEYIFYNFFEQEKMEYIYKQQRQNKKLLDYFMLAIQILIGNIEYLLEEGFVHNDEHDGNFGFNKDGSFKFIDFGKAFFVKNMNKTLYKKIIKEYKLKYEEEKYNEELIIKKYLLRRELKYFREMYYYNDDDDINLDKLYEDKRYSPVKTVIDLLDENEYEFGSYIKYRNKKLNVNECKGLLDKIDLD